MHIFLQFHSRLEPRLVIVPHHKLYNNWLFLLHEHLVAEVAAADIVNVLLGLVLGFLLVDEVQL